MDSLARFITEYLYLGLQILGIYLAAIEQRYPLVADKIEDYIDKIGAYLDTTGTRLLGDHYFKNVFTSCFVTSVFMVIIPHAVGFYQQIFPKYLHMPYMIFVYFNAMIVLIYLIFVIIFGLSDFIHFLNKFSNGRAIGTFGLVIALPETIQNIIQQLTKLFG